MFIMLIFVFIQSKKCTRYLKATSEVRKGGFISIFLYLVFTFATVTLNV